jgi:PAS domain S-box-containing protein
MRLDGRSGMRGIVDTSTFLQPANAMEFVDTILEASTEYSIIGQGLDGTILLWSSGAKRLYGYRREEIVRKVTADILHTPEDVAEGLPLEMRQAALTSGKWEGTVTRVRRDGSRFIARVVITPWRNQHGEPVGFLLISKDISKEISDAADRKQAEADLRQAKLDAEQANQAKSEYLSRMSHELRTPLNAILGFAQLLEMDELHNEQRDSLSHILSGARHLLALINEVLDIAAIEAGRLSLSLESVTVLDLLAEAVGLIRPLADQHGILLVSPEQTCDEEVLGDRQRLKQILLNLLSNAVKYNREGGSVQLTCERVPGERLQIKVTDTGPGIPPEAMERLFVPFERLGSERSAVEGTGLGLPLSRRLAEAMGGTLEVVGTVDQGSTFWVELPLANARVQHLRRVEPRPQQEHPKGERPALTVLYVGDNPSDVQLVEQVLRRRRGVTLISAMRPQLGLDLADQHHPDLVLLDLDLPDMSGEDVLRRLRAGSKTADVPVAILTGAGADPGLFTRLLENGVRTLLTQPLDAKALLTLLDTIATEQEQARSQSRSS